MAVMSWSEAGQCEQMKWGLCQARVGLLKCEAAQAGGGWPSSMQAGQASRDKAGLPG